MKGTYHLCQTTCRHLDGLGHRDGRSWEKYRDEDRGCYLLQWQSHTTHFALLYMHAQMRSVMMSTPYPPYNWVLKPGKVQGHTCISSQKLTRYIFQFKVLWNFRPETMPSTFIDKHGVMFEIYFATINSNISICPYSNFSI